MASVTQLWNFPSAKLVDDKDVTSQSWQAWFGQVTRVVSALSQSGTTADRPADTATAKAGLYVGRMYYDTDLHQPIWYDPDTGIPDPAPNKWRDATGTFV
jgi:hypothetical protein